MAKTNDLALTGLEIIESALRKIGILEAGGSASASQQADGLEALNVICKGFDNAQWLEYLTKYNFSISGVNATASYDLDGTVSDVTSVTAEYSLGTNTIESPMEIITAEQYQKIPDKARPGVPQVAYITKNLSTPAAAVLDEKMYVWPVPETTPAVTIKYTGRRKVQKLGVVGDYLDLPDEWSRYIIWQLAHDLAFEYRLPPQERVVLANNAMTALQLTVGLPAQPTQGATDADQR